jgi:hypothetical protein
MLLHYILRFELQFRMHIASCCYVPKSAFVLRQRSRNCWNFDMKPRPYKSLSLLYAYFMEVNSVAVEHGRNMAQCTNQRSLEKSQSCYAIYDTNSSIGDISMCALVLLVLHSVSDIERRESRRLVGKATALIAQETPLSGNFAPLPSRAR